MNDLIETWDAIGHPRILVIGDLILDRYTWGDAERISPEAPVLVLKADTHDVRLGGAASVAGLLRALDADVALAGVIGDDSNGRVLRRLLDETGIDATLVVCDELRPTTTKERFLGRAEGKHLQQIIRVDEESDRQLPESLDLQLVDLIVKRLDEFDAVLISDYAKGVCCSSQPPESARRADEQNHLTSVSGKGSDQIDERDSVLVREVIRSARSRQIPVLVDPARSSGYERYRDATLIKPNRTEAGNALGCKIDSIAAGKRAGEQLCRSLHLEAAVVTLDQDGMVLSQRNEPSQLFSVMTKGICDITGAGDTALAMLGLVLADVHSKCNTWTSGSSFPSEKPEEPLPPSSVSQDDLCKAVRLANLASGLQIARLGVAPIARSEIRSAIRNSTEPECSKIVSLDDLQGLRERYRREGKTVVLTNGCFDLLHVGHLSCLKAAADMGDVLIVAINSDDSVRRLKGTGRPVITQTDRAAMLAGLECVAHVLVFDEPTPHELLHRLRPEILVKGQTANEVVGHEVIEAYGGQVVVAGFVPGISTTQIVRSVFETIPSL